ncbi:MAG: DUF378 domain-containing protein [Firmicutes bacterium]|nr:DUF378 domain-containing protein [Bacillota bacterium]
MKKKNVLKYTAMIAFGVLLLGGLNFLLMGLFRFDMYAGIFGGADAVVARIFYSLFGIASLVLLGIIIAQAFTTKPQRVQSKRPTTSTHERPATTNAGH